MQEKMTDNGKGGALLILGAGLLWGTTGTAQALAPAGVNSVSLGTLRVAVGGLCLLIIAFSRGSFRGITSWPLLTTVIAAFFVAAYQLTFFAAVATTGVAVGTMVAIGSSPIAAGLLGYFVRQERLGLRWMTATALAVAGCSALAAGSGSLQVSFAGVLLALGAGFAYAAYTVSVKSLLDTVREDAAIAVVFSVAALMMVPLLFFFEVKWALEPRGMAVILHLGLFSTALSYLLFAKGLKRVKVGTAATLSLAEPLTAALLGVVILGERLATTQITGIMFIFSGIILLSMGSFGFRRVRKE